MEKRIEKLENNVKILEKKLETLLTYLEQIRRVVDINIVDQDMLLAVIEQKAQQVSNIAEKPETNGKQASTSVSPSGKKISLDDVDLDDKTYFFVLTSWIAKQKNVPVTVECLVEEVTTKAIQVKYNDKLIWLPKSQIKEVWREEDFA